MSTQVQFRRGTTLETTNFTGASGEVTVDTTKNVCVVHDASKAGGYPLMREDGVNSALALGSPANCSLKFVNNPGTGIYSPGVDQVAIATAGVQRFLIDSSGNTTYANSLTATSFIPTGSSAPINGLYLPGANQVALSTAGTGRLFIDANGGISTSSTAWQGGVAYQAGGLQIGGSVYAKAILQTNGTIRSEWFYDNADTYLQAKAGIFYITNTTANPIGFYTNGNERLRITSAGLVGVGTSSPQKELQITAVTPTIRLEESSASAKRLELSINSAAEALISAPQSSSQLLFATSGSERLRIDSSGRLLVGTSSGSDNSALLKVQGNVGGSTGTGWIDIRRGLSTPGSGSQLGLLSFSDSSGNQYAYIESYVDAAAGTNDYPGRLVFSTTADGASSPTERMRIANTGSTNIFASTANVLGAASNQAAGTTYYLFYGAYNASSTTTGTTCFLVFTNGNVQNTNNSYAGISDAKLKENIVDATSQWSDIKALQVRKYNFKEGQTHTQIGLIAQEVELISPGLVYESPDRDEDGNDLGTVTKSVNYSVLYMKAVKALQEAMERIEQLEAKVAALESA